MYGILSLASVLCSTGVVRSLFSYGMHREGRFKLSNESGANAVGEQTDCWVWERHRDGGHRKKGVEHRLRSIRTNIISTT
jgi:hypothetical protein